MSGIVLPGQRRAKPAIDPDERTRASHFSDEKIEKAVLQLLGKEGPQHKWEVRERLGINDAAIYAALQRLRERKRVKWIGIRRQSRWCLMEYIEPAGKKKAPLFAGGGRRPTNKIAITPKASAPATSWWTNRDREAFAAAARERFAKPRESSDYSDASSV
ncbi:MAG TPA: hypothetical protein VEU08_19985 [Vicinamibacterales bacterium]|nr:hypothetical protein [Vicinamibacterales bacterium]